MKNHDVTIMTCSDRSTFHLGYYQTENSTIRSNDPENPYLEPDMEWCHFCGLEHTSNAGPSGCTFGHDTGTCELM